MPAKYEIIVVGTGISGLSAAIYLKKGGVNVALMSKEEDPSLTNTNLAQGGIIAWREEDSPQKLSNDLYRAGCEANNKSAVNIFCRDGGKLVFEFLIDMVGMQFDRNAAGTLDYAEEAAHSVRRILHYYDKTGQKIEEDLLAYARSLNIPFINPYTAVELIINSRHSVEITERYMPSQVMGVYALNNRNREVEMLLSHGVILATGGIGGFYAHSTNIASSTGDGLSLAYRAGAQSINGEFVQFHPTALYQETGRHFLISEAVRGEGARLITDDGIEFMSKYSPDKELAPRDVVARAIYREMQERGKPFMYLDLARFYTGQVPIEDRFPQIFRTCADRGIDIRREPIPVVPAEHYYCGGINVDIWGRTTIKNLYAVGEVSCTGLHGANRLASTSLLEGLLWGKRAAEDIISGTIDLSEKRLLEIPEWDESHTEEEIDGEMVAESMAMLKDIMWKRAGIERTVKGLQFAQCEIKELGAQVHRKALRKKNNREFIELRHAISSALIVIESALINRNSLGCHYIKPE